MATSSANISNAGTVTAPIYPVTSVSESITLTLVPKRRKKKGVRWTEDTIDNEFLGKKSSKKCCIFHKQRPFGEWSDDDSDQECDDCEPPPKGEADPAPAPAAPA